MTAYDQKMFATVDFGVDDVTSEATCCLGFLKKMSKKAENRFLLKRYRLLVETDLLGFLGRWNI